MISTETSNLSQRGCLVKWNQRQTSVRSFLNRAGSTQQWTVSSLLAAETFESKRLVLYLQKKNVYSGVLLVVSDDCRHEWSRDVALAGFSEESKLQLQDNLCDRMSNFT